MSAKYNLYNVTLSKQTVATNEKLIISVDVISWDWLKKNISTWGYLKNTFEKWGDLIGGN